MNGPGLFILLMGIFLITASLFFIFNYDFEWWTGVALKIVVALGVANVVIGAKLVRGKK